MDKEKCICAREFLEDPETYKVYVHLMWCPQGYTVKEYDVLPWWKKIFKSNPRYI